jgi:hypothetical protein
VKSDNTKQVSSNASLFKQHTTKKDDRTLNLVSFQNFLPYCPLCVLRLAGNSTKERKTEREKQREREREKTKIDVSASLTPISCRPSFLEVVRVGQQPGGSSGIPTRRPIGLLHTNSISKTAEEKENGADAIPRFLPSYSISSGWITQNRRRIPTEHLGGRGGGWWQKRHETLATSISQDQTQDTRHRQHKRIHAQTKNPI